MIDVAGGADDARRLGSRGQSRASVSSASKNRPQVEEEAAVLDAADDRRPGARGTARAIRSAPRLVMFDGDGLRRHLLGRAARRCRSATWRHRRRDAELRAERLLEARHDAASANAAISSTGRVKRLERRDRLGDVRRLLVEPAASPRARRSSACRSAARGAAGSWRSASMQLRGPTIRPACGPPSTLSPLNVTTSAPSASRSPTIGSFGRP